MVNKEFWVDKKVLVTGHTGFKGSWLTILLRSLGAEVSGYSLPPTRASVIYQSLPGDFFQFELLEDLNNKRALQTFIHNSKPEVIFHLAAQASVLESLRDPLKTWFTNVHGTQNLLNVLLELQMDCTCVVVTTDKVYQNLELNAPFKETDPLGGNDPYSSSKAAVELLVKSYNSSFPVFANKVRISTARAGNVIGGGDWLENRIIPDLMRAYFSSTQLTVRNPNSIRPWQHVLDALHGYLLQAEQFSLHGTCSSNKAFNFGPAEESQVSVQELISEFSTHVSMKTPIVIPVKNSVESRLLSLNSKLAMDNLSWSPTMNFKESVELTANWYRANHEGENPFNLTQNQISDWLASDH
jgi:CDP-glucose 4,6-dehydratase